jgi:hypothetical protein
MVLELQILTWEGTKKWRDNVFICGIKFQKKEMYVLLEFRLNVHSAIILSCVINEIT